MKSFTTTFTLLLLLAAHSAGAQETCPNSYHQGDRDIWEQHTYLHHTGDRDWYAQKMNYQKDDWDESWGWAKYNNEGGYKWEFVKAMNAADLLNIGIDDDPHQQGDWTNRGHFLGIANAEFSTTSMGSNRVFTAYKNSLSQLSILEFAGSPAWYAPDSDYEATRTDVSSMLSDDKSDFRIQSSPIAVSRKNNLLEVLAIDPNKSLLHFVYNGAAWTVNNGTNDYARRTPVNGSYRYFMEKNLVVVKAGSSKLHAFGVDNFNHLIHYMWEDAGTWYAEDITEILGGGVDVRVPGKFMAIAGGRDIQIFFTTTLGQLKNFSFRKDDAGNYRWVYENLSTRYGWTEKFEGVPSGFLSPASTSFIAVRSDFRLYAIAQGPNGIWLKVNLTPPGSYAFESDPLCVSRGSKFHVFGSDINDHLIHFYTQAGSGILTQDLTAELYGFGINNIVVGSPSDDRLDIIGIAINGWLGHYYWQSNDYWNYETLNVSGSTDINFDRVQGKPQLCYRTESSLHVVGISAASANMLQHFYSQVGEVISPWHTSAEYFWWARGSKHDYKIVPGVEYDGPDPDPGTVIVADAWRSSWSTDRVKMYCRSFAISPAERASTLLHEATHMIHWRWDHDSNDRDAWYEHDLHDSDANLDGDKKHSMRQLQIEFLADIGEFAIGETISSAYVDAIEEANVMMSNYIRNPPEWIPGYPRPM